MVTVGFDYITTFRSQRIINGNNIDTRPTTVTIPYTAPGNKKLGKLFDIILLNPRQRAADVANGRTRLTPLGPCIATVPPTPCPPTLFILPTGIQWAPQNGQMTGGPLYGSSTCYLNEAANRGGC